MNIKATISNLQAAKAAGVQVKSFSMTETHRGVAWSLKLFLNGKSLGMMSNSGAGGETRIDVAEEKQKEVVARLKANNYSLDLSYSPELDPHVVSPQSDSSWLEYAACQIGDEITAMKTYKKKAKTGLYIEKKSEPTCIYYKEADSERLRGVVKAHFGDDFVQILNDSINEL